MAFRRPSILTVVLALVGLAIMLSLGFWQLERLDWKTQLLATVDARLQKLPLPLPATPSDDWEFRRVTVEGPVAGGQWFRFPGRTRDNQVGDALMLLIQRDDGSLVAVEYGWVGFNAPLPPVPLALAAEGVLRHRLEPGIFTPNNDPAHNAWYSVNPAAMAETAGLDSTLALSQYLKPSDWVPSMPNDHLQYAITWFALAGVFCVIFILFHRKKRSAP
jgi:surfeit locus 1 family protein